MVVRFNCRTFWVVGGFPWNAESLSRCVVDAADADVKLLGMEVIHGFPAGEVESSSLVPKLKILWAVLNVVDNRVRNDLRFRFDICIPSRKYFC